MLHQLLEFFQDPTKVAAFVAALAVALWREIKKRTDPNPAAKRTARELEALAEQEIEVVVAAEEFSKDAELERRGALIVELTIENRQLRTEVAALKEAKLDLEMQAAEAQVSARTAHDKLERLTGKHKVLPGEAAAVSRPAPESPSDRIITERPRSPKLPPLLPGARPKK